MSEPHGELARVLHAHPQAPGDAALHEARHDDIQPPVLNIQEFLLTYALDGPVPPARRQGVEMSDPDQAALTAEELRAEIERHADRTMTVLVSNGITAITRCGVCPKEPARPCTALRVLALPYTQHPAYRPEWRIAPDDIPGVPAQRVPAEGSERLVPSPHVQVPDLPPPGMERRSLLRQFDIPIGRFDFSDEELAQRGVGDRNTWHTPAGGQTR